MEINTLDLIIISGISISVIISWFRGLIKEIFSLLSVIFGVFIAARYYTITAGFLSGIFENSNYLNVTAFILTLIVSSFTIGLIGTLIQKLIKKTPLKTFNHLGGALFGLFKGIVISFFIIMLLIAFFPPQTHFLKTSKVTPQIIRISTVMIYLIPDDLKVKFKEQLGQLKILWQKKFEPGIGPAPTQTDSHSVLPQKKLAPETPDSEDQVLPVERVRD